MVKKRLPHLFEMDIFYYKNKHSRHLKSVSKSGFCFVFVVVLLCHLLEIKFGHGLQKSLLSLLRSQLQNLLRVTGVQLCLSNRFHLQKRQALGSAWLFTGINQCIMHASSAGCMSFLKSKQCQVLIKSLLQSKGSSKIGPLI